MADIEWIADLHLEKAEFLLSVLNQMNEGVIVTDRTGRLVLSNRAAEEMFGTVIRDLPHSEWSKRYGFFLEDQVTPYPSKDLPLWRAIRGETVKDVHLFARNCRGRRGCWLSLSSKPWYDGHGVPRGGLLVCREISPHNAAGAATKLPRKSSRLSPRETQILKLIAIGKTTREIAQLLGVHYKTAVAHRTRLMQKLDIHETATLTRYAIRKGIVEP